MKKMTICKVCGKEIAKNAKACPSCGAKKKGHKGLIILAIVLGLGAVGAMGGSNTPSDTKVVSKEKEEIVYKEVGLSELSQALKDNAMGAKETYKDNYYILTGYVCNIDSDGKYFSIDDGEDFSFENYQIFVNKELKEGIKNLKKDCKVTVKVKCNDVGEIMGYNFNLVEW